MWRYLLCLMVFLLGTKNAPGEEVTIAVASNFTAPAKAIIAVFEEETNHQVKLVLGASGRIFAQIRHGAPFDIFLSADRIKPAELERQGMAVPDSRFTYAIGALALWSPGADFKVNNAVILKEGYFEKLALANPKLAPYGLAAAQVMQSLDLYEALSSKFVRGENIAQTYQFVASGNADLGFVALSQLGHDPKGSVWLIPQALHQPIRQDAILLKSAADNQAAQAFMGFLRKPAIKELIGRYGYIIPKEGQ